MGLVTTIFLGPSAMPGSSQAFSKGCWVNVAEANTHVRCLAHNHHPASTPCVLCQL